MIRRGNVAGHPLVLQEVLRDTHGSEFPVADRSTGGPCRLPTRFRLDPTTRKAARVSDSLEKGLAQRR